MVNAPHVAHPSNSPPRTAPSSSASPSPTPSAPRAAPPCALSPPSSALGLLDPRRVRLCAHAHKTWSWQRASARPARAGERE
ncbi:unnamed protein product [Closterium sp. NIES-64]|nr:unnamed protein product [Closterium sp. NIES-64]